MEDLISEIVRIPSEQVCIIVPTFNNHKTLTRVLDSILEYSPHVIVVNDGSTDTTSILLKNYSSIIQIHHPKNSGKGLALRNGFKKALELDYQYAITLDSDGQHFASDIPKFLEALEKEGLALLIGSRNMTQEGVPKKSSFGNKFSNFWFWFETGNRLEDTQSGFRLYPLQQLPKNFFTTKFEFEIEVIVRSAWKGIPVKNIPIQILYDPNERVSHFRPFRDFTRISILNTFLVLVTLGYIKPRDFFKRLKKKGFKKFFLENFLESQDSKPVKALSVALGVFVGIAPFWGFQTIIVLFLATLLGWNKLIAFAFSNISFPPFIPFIIYGSLQLGRIFVATSKPIVLDSSLTFAAVQAHINQYLVGSFILATGMSIIFGVISYGLMILFSTFRNK